MSSSAPGPKPGTAVWSAVTTYVQNDEGSLSEGSSESHATEESSPGVSPSHPPWMWPPGAVFCISVMCWRRGP